MTLRAEGGIYLAVAVVVAIVVFLTTRKWNREEPQPDPLWVLLVDGSVVGALWPLLLLVWLAFEIGGRIWLRGYKPDHH